MDPLYHYTSLNGVLGILGSRSLWASHVSYLNDASEFFHGISFAKDIAASLFMEDDYLAAFGWAARHALESISPTDLYVTSFSEKGDLLSQWRGYCPAGAGICLGFDFGHLKDFCQDRGYRLEKCIYTHNKQFLQVKSLVIKSLERFPKLHLSRAEFDLLSPKEQVEAELAYRYQTSEGGANQPEADAAVGQLCAEIGELAPLFKNEGFHEEAEWRILAKGSSEEIKFRSGPTYLVPYIELDILSSGAHSALKEVIIGPNPNQERCAESVEKLLSACGLNGVEVRISPIPFNSW